MKYSAPNNCPVCGYHMDVTSLSCDKCKTKMEGKYKQNVLSVLDDSDMEFLLTFIRCRGSIKDVEKEMGISYPTVRGKLDRLIESLGLNPVQPDVNDEVNEQKRKDILASLEKGEIGAKEAVALLKNIKI